MYENHRKSFYRDESRDFDDERHGEDRWRGEGRGWRDPYRASRFDSDREWTGGRGRAGYGSTFRDDDYGRYSGYGPEGASEYWRGSHTPEPSHWAHDAQHHRQGQGASSYGYGSGQPYGSGEGDSRYFTGQQGSWAQRSSYGAQGAGRFGADYREHGYTARRHDDDDRGFWDRASDEVASWFGDDEAARRREQDHRGRGPKGYTRSDERIRDDANDRLTDDPRVDASNITLEVDKGEITLNGTVSNRREKRLAEDCVDSVSGVKHVQNNLRVAETTGSYESNWTVSPSGTAEGGTIASQTGKENAKV